MVSGMETAPSQSTMSTRKIYGCNQYLTILDQEPITQLPSQPTAYFNPPNPNKSTGRKCNSARDVYNPKGVSPRCVNRKPSHVLNLEITFRAGFQTRVYNLGSHETRDLHEEVGGSTPSLMMDLNHC